MKKLIITVDVGNDGFNAYAENAEKIYGMGATFDEVRASIEKSIQITKGFDAKNVPAILKGKFQVVYKFTPDSFFTFVKPLLTLTGMEKYTGISNKVLSRYALGNARPRAAQLKKIQAGIHKLAADLTAIEL